MKISKPEIIEYYGIADAHGIESFLPVKREDGKFNSETSQQMAVMQLRAATNRQRHAIFYVVVLQDALSLAIVKKHLDRGTQSQKELSVLDEKIKKVQATNPNRKRKIQTYKEKIKEFRYDSRVAWINALTAMKNYAKTVAFPINVKEEYLRSWQLIPNPKLDPYSDAGWDESKQNIGKGTENNDIAIGG